jgi:hypothetical protein
VFELVGTSFEEINGDYPPIAGNHEIGPGVSRRLTGTARYPSDTAAIAQFFRLGNRLISKIGVSSLDRARDAIDLVAPR